jgi:hypothetical protein
VKAGAQITADARIGVNTLVLLLDEARVKDGIKVTASDVAFVVH